MFAPPAVPWLMRMQKYARNANGRLKVNTELRLLLSMSAYLFFQFWASCMMLSYLVIHHFVVVCVFIAVAVLAAPLFAV